LEKRGRETYILGHMPAGSVPRLLLFLICGLWATAEASAFSLGLWGAGTGTISAGQGFGPKVQYGGEVSMDFVFPVREWLAIDGSVEAFTVAPSDASGGFLYRGYSGGAMGLLVVFAWPVATSPRLGELRAGFGAGIAGALPSYWYTTLAFFYLEPRLRGILAWTPAGLPSFTFQLLVPVAMQLRRDLDYSVSAGIGLGVQYTFGRKR
jgi:hypothetical protein